jgi:hypothetical protein
LSDNLGFCSTDIFGSKPADIFGSKPPDIFGSKPKNRPIISAEIFGPGYSTPGYSTYSIFYENL